MPVKKPKLPLHRSVRETRMIHSNNQRIEFHIAPLNPRTPYTTDDYPVSWSRSSAVRIQVFDSKHIDSCRVAVFCYRFSLDFTLYLDNVIRFGLMEQTGRYFGSDYFSKDYTLQPAASNGANQARSYEHSQGMTQPQLPSQSQLVMLY